jgi:putative transposase
MPRTRYKIYEEGTPYFLTCTVVDWAPVLRQPALAQVVLDTWQFLQVHRRIELYAYVIMYDHLHWIASSADLSKEVRCFKSYSARRTIDHLKSKGAEQLLARLASHKRPYRQDQTYQLWQEGSHPQQIQSAAMMHQKVTYIHNNPVRREYVRQPVDWAYSSAQNYAGDVGLLPVTTEW